MKSWSISDEVAGHVTAFARELNGQRLGDTLALVVLLVRVVAAGAGVASFTPGVVDSNLVLAVSQLRQETAALTARCQPEAIDGSDVATFSFNLRDRAARLKLQAEQALQQKYDAWIKEVMDATEDLRGWCPSWELHKDELLSCPETAKALLGNPNFTNLGGGVDKIKKVLDVVQQLQSDGYGHWASPETLKAAKVAQDAVVQTVSVTWALHQWDCTVSKEANFTARKQAVLKLRAELAAKHIRIGTDAWPEVWVVV